MRRIVLMALIVSMAFTCIVALSLTLAIVLGTAFAAPSSASGRVLKKPSALALPVCRAINLKGEVPPSTAASGALQPSDAMCRDRRWNELSAHFDFRRAPRGASLQELKAPATTMNISQAAVLSPPRRVALRAVLFLIAVPLTARADSAAPRTAARADNAKRSANLRWAPPQVYITALQQAVPEATAHMANPRPLQHFALTPRFAPRTTAPLSTMREMPVLTWPKTLLVAAATAPATAPPVTGAASAAPATAAPVIPAPAAAPVAPAPTPTPIPTPAPIARDASGQPLVTNVFVETDLKQALSDIAAQTGVPIIADNTVQGTITADLKDVPLDLTLAMLLQTGGYASVKMNGYYLVGMPDPANPNFYLLSQTEVVKLNHVAPRTVLELLAIPYGRYLSAENYVPTFSDTTRDGSSTSQSYTRRSITGLSGSSGMGGSYNRLGASSPSVNLPPESDQLSITAPPALIARIKADIARIDSPRTQVMLEAVILEISEDALKDIGLNFTTRFLASSLLSGGSNITYSAIKGNETAQLTALVRNGTARLRANPRVSTAEGQTAEIEVGRENYFEIDTGNNNLSYATLEVIKSGILLRITPKVLEDTGEVMARIEPEVRDVTGRSSNGLPEITFRRAATNLRVHNGESIVIGGLINEFTSRTDSKIPILGDLPLVGKIFRGVNERKNKSEVVIIITPRILTDDYAPDGVRSPVLQNDLTTFREGQSWTPFAFPPKKK
jgi:type II secretory pathway component GspD/PulD (secretin)